MKKSQSQKQIPKNCQRNSEYEQMVSELQDALMKVKKQVQDLMVEKDMNEKDWDVKKSQLVKNLEVNTEERNKFLAEKQTLERKLADEQESRLAEHLELQRAKAKAKQLQQLEEEHENLQTVLNAKNKILDDKNDTIEDLKGQLEYLKKNENGFKQLKNWMIN
ncbi:hypothetical protein PPERSA_12533 [Pseudocohnilembus persalinus]|uniref:Uncharacterized protein n=1 Tax=Pseudocohnilembus persalinus TaxID=266149 RepID=A0A0V0QB41_PSEPJ|nr:hypothetical protein PPERSA_12533 [Pseudocohnilembus persalinus]|eukprot:KRW99429.1 hypothetical protein PPERSA_12533 [Pseudocohnilembus persalinus]